MTLSSHLNRALARGHRASKNHGHRLSPFVTTKGHTNDGPTIYASACLNDKCQAGAHISSLLEAHGRALHTHCPYVIEESDEARD